MRALHENRPPAQIYLRTVCLITQRAAPGTFFPHHNLGTVQGQNCEVIDSVERWRIRLWESHRVSHMAEMFLEKFKALVPQYLDDQWTQREGLSRAELTEQLEDSELPSSTRLPLVLEELYLALGRCEEILEAYHFIFDPDELVTEEGYLLFLEDEDERWVWGVEVTDLKVPDPLIHRRNNDRHVWSAEGATVSEFLFDLLEFSFEED